ncbi:MAG: hypothetical protein JO022_02655 [Acidobacteriaceae bacterium]|nr:hypothetical protein [Acidobacteriaceae bacterium]
MSAFRDYTIRNGLGIRVRDDRECRVIRVISKEWVEIGQSYPLPVDPTLLVWTKTGIPASILAVALRVYEADHPESNLRTQLTGQSYPRRRPAKPRDPVYVY